MFLALPVARGAMDDDDPAPVPVHVLQAQRDGQIELKARGNGPDRVKLEIRNTTQQRLKVVLPPGLVASAATGQGAAPGGGGGFQSMGLGTPTNRAGSFGQFQPSAKLDGFRSMPLAGADAQSGVVVPAGASVDFLLPSVCLNYGIPTPTPHDIFRIVDVDDYTSDTRARKALRSLATLGTSQTVAQAVAWSVFNGLTLDQLLSQPVAQMNAHEVALAGRFLDALDRTSSTDLVDLAYLNEGRLFVRIMGEGATEKDARRLNDDLDGRKLLGLTARAASDSGNPTASVASMLVLVQLTGTQPGQTKGKLAVRVKAVDGSWRQIGQYLISFGSYSGDLGGEDFATELDRTIARSFVSAKVAVRGNHSTTFKLDNRLPMSISSVVLNAGPEGHTAPVMLDGLGIGPLRSQQVSVPTTRATVEHVELNGL
jgi:hypothetical protein